jgi:hypothetical protein
MRSHGRDRALYDHIVVVDCDLIDALTAESWLPVVAKEGHVLRRSSDMHTTAS